MEFYKNTDNLSKIMHIVHGKSRISLRIIDWFVTNYSKKHFVVYDPRSVMNPDAEEAGYIRMDNGDMVYDSSGRFKVFNDYKMKLKAYSKKRFDPFCRWSRIQIPFDEQTTMETTLGQLNFFKWAIEHSVLEYIDVHYDAIERDMNTRNSNSKRRRSPQSVESRSDDEAGETEGPEEDMPEAEDPEEDSITWPANLSAIHTADLDPNINMEAYTSFLRGSEATPRLEPTLSVLDPASSPKSTCLLPLEPARKSDFGSNLASIVPFVIPSSNHNRETRKKREELSVYACKCIKKETVNVLVKFT
jgi:hypothetical protein